MRLLIVTQVVDRNHDLLGAFHAWVARFAEVFDKVEVICLYEGEHDLPANVNVHSLGKETKPSRLRYLWKFYRYVFLLRKRYDAVFVHMNPEYVMLAGWFWRLTGKTVFMWYAHKKGSVMRTLALPFLHRLVSVSKESNVDHGSRKFIGVGHGVDTETLVCGDMRQVEGPKTVLSIGRLSPVKEYDRLVEAADLLVRKYGRDDFIVRLVGAAANPEDDAYIERLKGKIADLGLNERFSFDGPVPNKDIVPLLCGASVFTSMQCKGGAGKSFLEAMAVGTPTVVCTPVFNDALGEWKDHVFYAGTAEDMAEKLDRCLSLDEDRRARLGGRLREIVEEGYDLKSLVRKVKKEFESVRHVRN